MRLPNVVIVVSAFCALAWPADLGADPRYWWNDTQVSFGGEVLDLDMDVDRGSLVVLAWLESSGPAEATLMLAISHHRAGTSFCPPFPVATALDPNAEIAVAAGLGAKVALIERHHGELGAVIVERLLGFLRDFHHFGHGGLHPERQLILGNPSQCLGMIHRVRLDFVQIPKCIEAHPAQAPVHAAGVGGVEYRVSF